MATKEGKRAGFHKTVRALPPTDAHKKLFVISFSIDSIVVENSIVFLK